MGTSTRIPGDIRINSKVLGSIPAVRNKKEEKLKLQIMSHVYYTSFC